MSPDSRLRTSNFGLRISDFGARASSAGSSERRRAAFTLVEVIIALTIVVVITAAAVPTFRGFRDEQLAREPVTELVRLAKEARLRAMREKRPYQVAFHSDGFTASRYFNPYLTLTELNEFLALAEAGITGIRDDGFQDEPDMDASRGRNTGATTLPLAPAAPQRDNFWNETYTLPENTRYFLKFWHELQPLPMEGEIVKLWVFQPSGICQPLSIDFERETATFHVEFGALTADIVREVIDLK
jgi:prepilin-type N-terminal cleavage/methylation domain-containing protein